MSADSLFYGHIHLNLLIYKVMQTRKRKVSKKVARAQARKQITPAEVKFVKKPENQETIKVELDRTVMIGDLAKLTGLSVGTIIGTLLKNGVMATINDSVDRETIEIIAPDLNIEVAAKTENLTEEQDQELAGNLELRPPVVVVLGHVDHGKTTLLDAIRKTNIAAKESGGITQHIGAYQIKKEFKDGERLITFLDTPGHAAFSALRAHGANVGDIAIIVVAADEGVKPQTKEALSHARAAGVPIITAITKADRPEAQIDKVKGELAELDLTPEDWGGKTPTVAVSAVAGTGLDDLLDTVLLIADLEELKAQTEGRASGIVIESHLEKGVGPIATVLVQSGRLKVGDAIQINKVWGKIRFLETDQGKRVNFADPAMPVRIAGLSGVAGFGNKMTVVADEKKAREMAENFHEQKLHTATILTESAEGKTKYLNLIIKADTDASIAAIKNSIEGFSNEDVQIKIVHEGVGAVNESDINMAISSNALVLSFYVNTAVPAKNLAEQNRVIISEYKVIYNLVDDIAAATQGLLEPEIVSETIGRLKILKVFKTTKSSQIVGGRVEEGVARDKAKFKIRRDGEEVGIGSINTLQRGQVTAQEVTQGEECGMGVDITAHIEEGDVLEIFHEIEKIRKINSK